MQMLLCNMIATSVTPLKPQQWLAVTSVGKYQGSGTVNRREKNPPRAPLAKSLRRIALASAAIGMLLLSTAVQAGPEIIPCDGALQAQQVAQLFFGRNVEDRARVSEADFSGFVLREVSPRFPDGFTVIDAAGQWRDARRGTIVHEASKIIEIVLPAGEDNRVKIEAIVEAYKLQFQQQSVGLIVAAACVRF
jgi:Protein of unknown function (DUF3574)